MSPDPLDVAKFRHGASGDIAKFQLDAFGKVQDLRIKTAQASMDLAMKATEIIEKRVKIAKDIEELRQLKVAHRDYTKSIILLRQKLRSVEREAEQLERARNNAVSLLWADMINPNILSQAWSGFHVLMNNLPSLAASEVFAINTDQEEHEPTNFIYPRAPEKECIRPHRFGPVVHLFSWMRRHAYVPRSSSSLFQKLVRIFAVIEKEAASEVASLEAEYQKRQDALLLVQQGNWRAAEIVK